MRNYRELELNHHIGQINELLVEFSGKTTNKKFEALKMHVLQLIIAVSSYEMERQGYDRVYDKTYNELMSALKEVSELKAENKLILDKKM